MKKLLYLIFFISITASAQSLKIRGMVTDSVTQRPLEKATLTLGGNNIATKPDGKFEFSKLQTATYKLNVHIVGYKALELTINLKKDTDLGIIRLRSDVKTLKDVEITSQQPLIQQKPGKVIYDMQADPESKAKSLLEMMHKLPFVTVDEQDNVSLRGSTSFKVFINGKPSAMMDNNLVAVLRTMPASSILRIEIITNPPAKYDAEGVGGIINIITTKSIADGYRGNLNARERFPFGPVLGGGLTLKDGKFGLNVYAGAGEYNTPQTAFSTMQQSTGSNASLLTQNGFTHNNSRNGYIGTELSYEVDSLHLLSGSFSYNASHNNGASYQSSVLTGVLQNYSYDIANANNSHGNSGDASINYQIGFKADKNRLLTFSYRYDANHSYAFSNPLFTNEVNYPTANYQQPNNSSIAEHTFQADLTYPVKKVMIDAGIKAILRSDNTDYQYLQQDPVSQLYEPVSSLGNQFYYTQNVFSLYNSYQFSLGKWSINAGLRAEETEVNAHFLSSGTVINPSYLNVVPSFSANHPLGSGNIGVAFNQRLQRPGINRLNPFVDKSNPNFVVTGNPNLQPNTMNQAQLSYSHNSNKFSIFLATDYIFVHDLALQETTFDPATQVTTATYQNTGKGEAVDLVANLNYSVTKQYSIGFNTNSTRFLLSEMSGTEVIYLHRWMTMEELNNTLRTGKGWIFTATARYNGNAPTSIQGYTNGYFSTNLGINKEVIKNKFTLAFSLNNPFTKFRDATNITNGQGFMETNINQTYFRTASIALNYNFGHLSSDMKRNKKGINNNDVNNGTSF